MASKASMLKSGANRASKGLFAGMTRIEEEQTKDKEPKQKKATKEEAVKEEVVVSEPVQEEKSEIEAEEPIKEEVETAVLKEELPHSEVENIVAEPINAESSRVVIPQIQPEPQPQPQQVYVQQPTIQPNYTQQVPQQVYQQPITQQYVQPAPIPVQPEQPTPVQYVQQSPMPVYENKMVQNEPKAQKQDKGSRYEKDKFLLLDIRGYRDYVEHMAKASNLSATKYIRNLIEQDMRVNWDIYQAHKELEEKLRGRR